MTKLVLLVLFPMLCFVQPLLTSPSVIALNGKMLYYENSPATFICKSPHAIWSINLKKITECKCPMKCEDSLFDKTRITAFCNGSSPILHFNQMKLDDNYNSLKCLEQSSWSLRLLVGRRNDDFYPKEPFALVNNNYSLVWEEKASLEFVLYDNKHLIGMISFDNDIDNYDEGNFVITKNELIIKKVDLKDNGKIFGCYTIGRHLSLLTLTVNVPVSFVSLHREGNGFLIEDETATFVCKVDESKPKASFEWFLFENYLEREITQNIDTTTKQNGQLWQTNSTLKLKLKRNFKAIRCRARIQGMAWTNSTSLQFDVKYPPPGNPNILTNNSELCVGEPISIRCEWRGGNPSASLTLTFLSKTKTKKDSVTIIETVTQEAHLLRHGFYHGFGCDGVHIAKNASSTYIIGIEYHPDRVFIDQTSYLKGNPSSLICFVNVFFQYGNIYSWSPGNYPDQKEININLNQVAGQEFTCTVVYQKCGREFTISSSKTKIIVEDYPIIKMPNRITVIENETMELNCISEGNPEPTSSWKIGNKIINSRMLRTSFTRQNASGGIQCIAVANSLKHGILKTVQTISIVVIYIEESGENADNSFVIILSSTIAIFIIIVGGIICFKYRSYSMTNKAANKSPSLPTKSDESVKNSRPLPTKPKSDESIYIEMQRTEAKPTEPIYTEMRRAEDEPRRHVYENIGIQQKD